MTKRSDTPAYQIVATELRLRISAGEFPDGVRLPTEAELSERYGLSRQTIRRAFVDLVADRTVHRVRGRGTFATPHSGRYLRQLGSIEDLMSLSLDTMMEILRPPHRRVDIDAAGRLRLDTDVVHSVMFRRSHEDTPFVHTTVHLSPNSARLVADAPELAAGSVSTATVIGLLDPRLARPISEAAQSITVAPANADVAAALCCPVGHPMLRVDRLYSNDLDEPVELSTSYFLSEHYTYRVTLRRTAD